MAKGRPRKPGLRHPGGKLVQVRDRDGPTPEYERRRIQLAGGGDVTMTTCPLDILFTRRIINLAMHEAGHNYARLYRKVIANPHPAIMPLERKDRGTDDNPDNPAEERRFRDMAEALKQTSRATKDAVENCCVFERMPRALLALRGRKSDEHLFDGLRVLAAMTQGRRVA